MYAFSKQMLLTGMLVIGVVCISIPYKFALNAVPLNIDGEKEESDEVGR